ncbi:transporter, cation channel family protein [Toxoplasma gondii GT1]|uniref:Transporter, cation channel family protein n=4 Tax=Toxoplasma gondii TaxID=5811 RepID=S7UUH4_TOXGG|nr:transporter, cation channel family protein [Toxoplasma gondii GT1]
MELILDRPECVEGCEGVSYRTNNQGDGRRVSIQPVPNVVGIAEKPKTRCCNGWTTFKLICIYVYEEILRFFSCGSTRDYARKSYNVFNPNNRFRRICTLLKGSTTLKYLLITYACTNELVHLEAMASRIPLRFAELLDIILVILLLLEFVYETVAIGLWKGRKCYFRQPCCLFNFAILAVAISEVIVTYLARCHPPDYIPQVSWYTSEVALFFELVRKLRVLRLFETKTCKLAFTIFRKCVANLLALAGLVFIFVFFYLIVYFHTYGYTQFNVCHTQVTEKTRISQAASPSVTFSHDTTDASLMCDAESGYWEYDLSQEYLCRPDLPCRDGTECRNIFTLPRESTLCSSSQIFKLQQKGWSSMYDTPLGDWGMTGFHNAFSALISFLQCVTLEGWSEVMYRLADGDGTFRGVLIYILHHSVVILGNLLLMNLVVAVMWESTLLQTNKSRAVDAKKEDLQMFEILGLEWIRFLLQKAEDNEVLRSEAKIMEFLLVHRHGVPRQSEEVATGETDLRDEDDCSSKLGRCWISVWQTVYTIVARKQYATLVFLISAADALFIIIADAVELMDTYRSVNCFFVMCYTVDAILQLVAFGCREFVRDGFKIFDLVLAVVGVVEVLFSLVLCGGFATCYDADADNARDVVKTVDLVLNVLHSFRLFKLVRNFTSLRLLLEVIADLLRSVVFFYALLLFHVYVFATVGFALFFDPKYGADVWSIEVTKYSNFKTIWQALLLVFGLLTGESWNVAMREFYSVYIADAQAIPGSALSSNVIFESSANIYIICMYIFVAVLFLCCFIYNVFGAVLIGQYVTARKMVFNSHIFQFIKLCRELGIEMPTRAALDRENLQRMYSLASPRMVGQKKARRALSEFLRPRSWSNQERLGFSKASTGAAWMIHRLTRSISRASTLRRRSQRLSSEGRRTTKRKAGKARQGQRIPDTQRQQRAYRVLADVFPWRQKKGRSKQGGPYSAIEGKNVAGQEIRLGATGDCRGKERRVARPSASLSSSSISERQCSTRADNFGGLWAVGHDVRPGDGAGIFYRADTPSGLPATEHRAASEETDLGGSLSFCESVCYLFSLSLIYFCDTIIRLVSCPFKRLNARIVSYDIQRPDAIVDFIRFILVDEGLVDASKKTVVRASGSRRRGKPGSMGDSSSASEIPDVGLEFFQGGRVSTFLRQVMNGTAYRWIVAGLDIASLACLVVECMLTDNYETRKVFGVLEWVFACVFLLEALLRISAYGCCRGRCVALDSVATRTAFAVSLLSCILLIVNQVFFVIEGPDSAITFVWQLPLFRVVKVLRSLRSFLLFSLVEMWGVRLVVRSLVACRRSLLILSAFLTLVYIIFALIFSRIIRVDYVPPEDPNEVAYTFRTFKDGWLGVFVLATNEGWPLLLAKVLDRSPTQRVTLTVLFFIFISTVSIFAVKMCVGIIVDASRRKKARMEMEGSLLSATVHKWIEIQELLFNAPLQHGDTMPDFTNADSKKVAFVRKKLAAIVTSEWFRIVVALHTCICCLLLFLYGPWYDLTLGPYHQNRRVYLHIALVGMSLFFFFEIGVKIFVRGQLFFRDTLDIMDAIVCCLLIGIFVVDVVWWTLWRLPLESLTFWLLSFRLFRVARFLYRQMPFFQTLFTTICRVMKSFLNVLTLLCLSIFFFAMWGVVLFNDAPVEKYFNRHVNFKALTRAMMALVGSCTGEDWHMILQQLRMYYTTTGQNFLAYLVIFFFICFIILVFFILMDLFTAAVLDEYMDTVKDENLWKISHQHRILIERWNPKNEPGNNYKSLDDMVELLSTIDHPIGIKHRYHPGEKRKTILAYIAKYGLPIHEGSRVHLRDAVLNSAKRACEFHAMSHGVMDMQDGQVELNPHLITSWIGKFPEVAHTTAEYDLRHYLAAETIQNWFRKRHMVINGVLANPEWCAARVVSFLVEAQTARLHRPSGRNVLRGSLLDHRQSASGKRRSQPGSQTDSTTGSSRLVTISSGESYETLCASEEPTPMTGGINQARMSLTEPTSARGSAAGSSSNSRRGSLRPGNDLDLAPRVLFESCLLVPEGESTKQPSSKERLSVSSMRAGDGLLSATPGENILERRLGPSRPARLADGEGEVRERSNRPKIRRSFIRDEQKRSTAELRVSGDTQRRNSFHECEIGIQTHNETTDQHCLIERGTHLDHGRQGVASNCAVTVTTPPSQMQASEGEDAPRRSLRHHHTRTTSEAYTHGNSRDPQTGEASPFTNMADTYKRYTRTAGTQRRLPSPLTAVSDEVFRESPGSKHEHKKTPQRHTHCNRGVEEGLESSLPNFISDGESSDEKEKATRWFA